MEKINKEENNLFTKNNMSEKENLNNIDNNRNKQIERRW